MGQQTGVQHRPDHRNLLSRPQGIRRRIARTYRRCDQNGRDHGRYDERGTLDSACQTNIRCSGPAELSDGGSGGVLVNRSNFRHSRRHSLRRLRVTILRI